MLLYVAPIYDQSTKCQSSLKVEEKKEKVKEKEQAV
jgi:hypothetical protein